VEPLMLEILAIMLLTSSLGFGLLVFACWLYDQVTRGITRHEVQPYYYQARRSRR
jgi:hypothetical protein